MIHFQKIKNKFQPVYKSDHDKWSKLHEGIIYTMRYKSDRNVRHHKKLFGIAKTIIENQSERSIWDNKEPYALIKATEIELGYVNEIVKFDGEIVFEPESINFEMWGQEKFEEFYDKAINLWCEKFDFDRNVLEMFSEDNL